MSKTCAQKLFGKKNWTIHLGLSSFHFPWEINHPIPCFSNSESVSQSFAFETPIVQIIKNLPAIQEIWVWSPGQEDSLEKGMATHSSTLAWRIPMDREAWRDTVNGVTKSWSFSNSDSQLVLLIALKCQARNIKGELAKTGRITILGSLYSNKRGTEI